MPDFQSSFNSALSGLDNSVNVPSYSIMPLRGFQSPTEVPLTSSQFNFSPQDFNINAAPPMDPQSATNGGSSSFWDHPFSNLINGNYPLAGALTGFFNGLSGINDPNQNQNRADVLGNFNYDLANSSPLTTIGDLFSMGYHGLKDVVSNVPNAIQQAEEGWNNPQQVHEAQAQGLSDAENDLNMGKVGNLINNFAFSAASDPLSYIPIGAVAKGVKFASDAAHITPIVSKGLDAINDSKLIQNPLVQGVKDAIGTRFVKNYGVSPELDSIIQDAEGEKALHQVNNLKEIQDLQQGHSLAPDRLNEIGHVTEQTLPGTLEQQSLAQSLSDLLKNGSRNSGIGADLLSRTASAVSGKPLLEQQITNYFPHIYNNVPDELKGVFPRKAEGVSGLSPNGTYNLPRTFTTLQDAIGNGLKPELNPFVATGTRLDQMANAFVNNKVIDRFKNTPGLSFDKDPIDEVSKLVKTGRMNTEQAAQHLGMTVDDMKKGFVQSKIPQLRGAYIRPGDEKSLTEYLNPSRPSGIFGALNKLNNLYNKGFLLNPLPHLHNVSVNGIGLGGAKPEYVKETMDAIKSGNPSSWYLRAVKAGAVNNPVEGSFAEAITRQAPSNILSKAKKKGHDLLWNTDASIRTALFRQGIEEGMNDAEAATRTNKFMVDYNNLTPFEKQYIKPLVPFYTWKKGNIPLQASQILAQTPKYALYGHGKDSLSQAWSGLPTDQKGRIQSDNVLSDGSRVAVDMYNPMDEPGKIAEKGVVPWAFNSLNPFLREAIAQGTSAAGSFYPETGLQNKFPIYNSGAPADYNARRGIAHALQNLNPLNGSAIAGEFFNPKDAINGALGVSGTRQETPGETPTELVTKLLGGFTGRDNPAKDAYYQAKSDQDTLQKKISYERQNGIPISKQDYKQAYKKIPFPMGQ